MIDQLQEQIKVVVEARRIAQIAIGNKKVLVEEWEEKYSGFLADLQLSIFAVSEEEKLLRDLTLQAYAETGDKAPAEGVGIRERTVLTYENKIALDWAKAHKMALKLDTSAFEKIAKADPPDFVKITTEPQATIATNLDDKIKG